MESAEKKTEGTRKMRAVDMHGEQEIPGQKEHVTHLHAQNMCLGRES